MIFDRKLLIFYLNHQLSVKKHFSGIFIPKMIFEPKHLFWKSQNSNWSQQNNFYRLKIARFIKSNGLFSIKLADFKLILFRTGNPIFYHGSGLKFKILLWSEYSNVTSHLYRFLQSLTRVSMIQSEKYFKYSDSVSVSRGNPFEPFYNLFFLSKYCFLYSFSYRKDLI